MYLPRESSLQVQERPSVKPVAGGAAPLPARLDLPVPTVMVIREHPLAGLTRVCSTDRGCYSPHTPSAIAPNSAAIPPLLTRFLHDNLLPQDGL